MPALLDGQTDKEIKKLLESSIVSEASRQSCDQSYVTQSVIHSEAWQQHSTSALQITTPISSVT